MNIQSKQERTPRPSALLRKSSWPRVTQIMDPGVLSISFRSKTSITDLQLGLSISSLLIWKTSRSKQSVPLCTPARTLQLSLLLSGNGVSAYSSKGLGPNNLINSTGSL